MNASTETSSRGITSKYGAIFLLLLIACRLEVNTEDITNDPTLQRTRSVQCPKCPHMEAVYFQAKQKMGEDGMKLFFVCCNRDCLYQWKD